MACFETLPTELILQIISHVQSKDIDSLISTSKRIYEASDPFVRRHQSHKRVLGHCRCGAGQSHGTISQLLETVLLQPSLRFYIKKITIASWESHWHSDPQRSNLRTRFLARALEGGRENHDIVIQHLKRHRPDHCHLPVLLALLWNLCSLEIVEIPYNYIQRATENMEKLKEAGDELTTFNQQIRRVSLTKAHFEGPINGSDIVNALVRIAPAIENLRICGTMRDPETEGVGFTYWQSDPIPSSLTCLHMTNFAAHEEAIRYFLKKFTVLQIVTWEEPSVDTRTGGEHTHLAHANTIALALQQENKTSLQDLTLSTSHDLPCEKAFVRDLSPFRFLKSLNIYQQALITPNGSSLTKLPPSLQILRISCRDTLLNSVYPHLPTACATIIGASELPRLRMLHLDNYHFRADGQEHGTEMSAEHLRNELENLQRLCEERGIEFCCEK